MVKTMTMTLDEMLNKFRIGSRELFNNYFRISDPYQNNGWEMEERFSDIEEVFFQKLVCEPMSLDCVTYGYNQPKIFVKIRLGESSQIMINRDIDSGYWDYPQKEINNDVKMTFISFFDWDQLGFRDNQYVRVLIVESPNNNEIIGKHALIESRNIIFISNP